MREVVKTALVPFSVEQMFALVEDFERYPQFVPWVAAAKLLERGAEVLVGQLEMRRGPLHETFTTRTVLHRSRRIDLALMEGPFKIFEGAWTFEPLGERGSKVSLRIRFEFTNPMSDLLLAGMFEKSCRDLVEAFVARARSLYTTS